MSNHTTTRALVKPAKGTARRQKAAASRRTARTLAELYADLYARDGYRCVACRRRVEPNGPDDFYRAHPHHIVFRSVADPAIKHTLGNLCTTCPECHDEIHAGRLTITGTAPDLTITRVEQDATALFGGER